MSHPSSSSPVFIPPTATSRFNGPLTRQRSGAPAGGAGSAEPTTSSSGLVWSESQSLPPTVTKPRSTAAASSATAVRPSTTFADAVSRARLQSTNPTSPRGVSDAQQQAGAGRTNGLSPRPSSSSPAAAREAAEAKRSENARSAATRHRQHLPPHIQTTAGTLRQNFQALTSFAAEMPMLQAAETHTAATRLGALLRAQQCALDDLLKYVQEEVRHGRDRISDLMRQMAADEQPTVAGAPLHAYRAMYAILHTTATAMCANQAYVLLYDRAPNVRPMREAHQQQLHLLTNGSAAAASPPTAVLDGLFDSPRPRKAAGAGTGGGVAGSGGGGGVASPVVARQGHHVTPTAARRAEALGLDADATEADGLAAGLRVVAQVCSEPIGAAGAPPELSRAVYKTCAAVGGTCSALNLTVRTAPPGTHPRDRSVLAVPLRAPGQTTTAVGVVCFIGKLVPTTEARLPSPTTTTATTTAATTLRGSANIAVPTPVLRAFTHDDELRAAMAAEQLAIIACSIPVGVSETGSAAVAPATWQIDWQRWCASGRSSSTSTTSAAGGALPAGHLDPTDFVALESSPAVKRRFILRSELSAGGIHKLLANPQRQVMSGAGLLVDLAERLAMAETSLKEQQRAAEYYKERALRTEEQLAATVENLAEAQRDGKDMRVACERVLRLAFLEKSSPGAVAKLAQDVLPRGRTTLAPAEPMPAAAHCSAVEQSHHDHQHQPSPRTVKKPAPPMIGKVQRQTPT